MNQGTRPDFLDLLQEGFSVDNLYDHIGEREIYMSFPDKCRAC